MRHTHMENKGVRKLEATPATIGLCGVLPGLCLLLESMFRHVSIC